MQEHRIEVRRRARYYVLGDVKSARELWVVLHGYGQLAEDFAREFEHVVSPTRAVVVPEALNRYYKDAAADAARHVDTPLGTTWMTRMYREAEIQDYVEYLDAVAEVTQAAGASLCVLGFSQGVATATRWMALGRRKFERSVLWAGTVPPELDLSEYAGRLPQRGVEYVMGTRDKAQDWIDLVELQRRFGEAGLRFELRRFEGGHRLDRDTLMVLMG